MITRRDLLKKTALASSAMTLLPRLANAQTGGVIKRAIPKTGEELPIIGLGSSCYIFFSCK